MISGRASAVSQRPGGATRSRLALFAFGDFAFNLYWQSISLFLFYYYTDARELPVATAAAIYSVASVWDGIANFAVGALSDRWRRRAGFRTLLIAGSVPLGLACVAAYLTPSAQGIWAVLLLAAGHLLFRTLYALVNVAYLVLGARLSADGGDRAFLAGLRMLFGTLAWVAVARGTLAIGHWVTASPLATDAYFGAAVAFAVAATLILLLVGALAVPRGAEEPAGAPPDIAAILKSLAANRAFVTLNLAMMAMILGHTVLCNSILYYFKYVLGDASAGHETLAWIGLVGLPAMPMWMLLRRRLGSRGVWFVAAAGAMAVLPFLLLAEQSGVWAAKFCLSGLQALFIGLHFVFWAMLPNTIEYGERATGLRVEGTVFGVAAMLQRFAAGLGTATLGAVFGNAGYVANAQQSPDMLEAIRGTMTYAPALCLALSCVAMMSGRFQLETAPHALRFGRRGDPQIE
jgi:GPH family glycoside/pentoside/hexuronide:cation symporter